tara:strand:+ start:347 stop:769 length:423 start_codon:yes stop_codon:yes gene_type:complete
MKKYAWGPILNALHEREEGIQAALNQAEAARKEISEATSRAAELLEEGKREKEKLVQDTQSELLEYRNEQQQKIDKQMASQLNAVKEEIIQQKRAAMHELKNNVAQLSVEIAEKIIKSELENKDRSDQIIKESVGNLEMS